MLGLQLLFGSVEPSGVQVERPRKTSCVPLTVGLTPTAV